MEKRIAGTKAKAVGAVLRHGHNSQRARARKVANEAGQGKLQNFVLLRLKIDQFGGNSSTCLSPLPFGEMTLFTRPGGTSSSSSSGRGGKRGLGSRLTRQDINCAVVDEVVETIVVQAGERRERQQGPSRGGFEQQEWRSATKEGKQGERGVRWSQLGGAETWLDGEGWRAERRAEADEAALFIPGLPSSKQRTQVLNGKESHWPGFL